jgi:hypothetical protein
MTEVRVNSISSAENKILLNGSVSSRISEIQTKSRKDKFGTPITKKLKIHKVSFQDQVDDGKRLVDVTHVRSYRKFNRMDSGLDDGKLTL